MSEPSRASVPADHDREVTDPAGDAGSPDTGASQARPDEGTELFEEEAAPPKRSHYAVTKQNTSLRNALWALGVTFAVVIVVAMLFFGVGNDPDREIPAESRVDVTASAERAREVAVFPLAVPEMDEGWSARQARFSGDASAPAQERWSLQYTSPTRSLVTLTQAQEVTPAVIQDAVSGARSAGEVPVEGLTCTRYTGEEDANGAAQQAIVCPGEGWGMVVVGRTESAELEELAGAAVRSLR